MSNLFLFTHYYPFREGAETFIENEINFASNYFERVYLIPMHWDRTCRDVPNNVTILQPVFASKNDILKKGLAGLRPKILKYLTKEFFIKKHWKNINSFRLFSIQAFIFSALMNSRTLKKIKKICNQNDIVYSYWGTGWGMVIPFMNNLSNKYVARFHRGDLYVERGSCFLFRESLLKRLNKAVFISKQGETYQKEHFPKIKFNSMVSYLGTKDYGETERSRDGRIRLLSCSHVHPIKRVELIFNALIKYSNPNIEWTHIGGQGEFFENLKTLVGSTPHNFKVNLIGQMTNAEVMNYYRGHPVDVFINVSSSEGLPVSIMEAISFGVPVIATEVGGTAEIVNGKTGVLLPADPTEEDIVKAFQVIQTRSYSPRKFWIDNFKADTNQYFVKI